MTFSALINRSLRTNHPSSSIRFRARRMFATALIFDTETTSMVDFSKPPSDPVQPDLVQLGMLLVDTNTWEAKSEMSLLVKLRDSVEIHPAAYATHGISAQDCQQYGVDPDTAALVYSNMYQNADIIVAHNLNFDSIVMETALHRASNTVTILSSKDDDDDDDDDDNNNNITSQVVAQIKRMIRYDADLSEFHQMSPEACKMQWGRTYCSPSLWEDVVKTITNCNMQWSGTCEMNVRLCTNLETPLNSFPTPKEIVQFTADELQSMCRLGYRSPWIRSIAQSIVDGSIDFDALEQDLLHGNATDQAAAEQRLKSLPGVGPFAKANILQLCGRTNAMPFDTETCRLWIEEHGASPDKKHRPKVMKDAEEHYRTNFPGQEWRAYWFDLWRNYESRRGMDSRRWTIPTGPHGEAAFSNAGTSSRKKKKNSNISPTEEEEVRKSSSDASVGSKRSVTPALSVALTAMTTSPSKRRRTSKCVAVVTPPSRTSIRNKRRSQR